MFIETSALVEILIEGPESLALLKRIEATPFVKSTGPTVVYEATVVLAGKQGLTVTEAERLVRALLTTMNVSVVNVTDQTASIALDAFARYGKGRHPAKLNFGDCFSYAGARMDNMPLLYVGQDFAQTDLA
ncbi:type II toxin-antitoxin system VapC family toxin [Aliirhizobium smilacinae]|uniref:Type II toxin-antitoxin system VapC family toxin n=1 Tax=Aliirhizobium smilacinae TaxID=1395944 RepID=A0A5C4XPX2_9HYPH|nr:type II toxin-antitoxin system VapC family toxin [Rhizobium smilacinae]TNM65492.1 type II toxin-antitoxin system VapC family toxin [Rhizobium smilacinae]